MASHTIETEHRCSECGEDLDVSLPAKLMDDVHRGRVLLFVGSGASTEAHNVLGDTFYDEIQSELEIASGLAFPDLMSMYVERFSRSDLLTKFFNRLRYIDSHPFFWRRATRFHRAVGQIPFFTEIVTTNWDDYFETVTGATPLVQGSDFDYWDLDTRKVLKIHGSVLNPGSVVATREEYDRSLEALRSGAVGTAARHLIATHSVVFVGYSLRDDDIKQVIDTLRHDLDSAARDVYFVHPNPEFVPPLSGAKVLNTSAGYFAELLDEALVDAGILLSLSMYVRAAELDQRLREARRRVDAEIVPWEHPMAIFNHSFQDGLGDAIAHALAARRTGEDRRHGSLLHKAAGYDEARKQANRARNYWNSAYIDGYEAGLIALGAPDVPLRSIPLYYCPYIGPETSFKRVSRGLRAGPAMHKGAFLWASRQMSNLPVGMYVNHPPVL